MAVELTEKEILMLKGWIAWQKQAAKTNRISQEMEAIASQIRDKVAALPEQSEMQTKRAEHQTEAAACDPLLATYKDLAENV